MVGDISREADPVYVSFNRSIVPGTTAAVFPLRSRRFSVFLVSCFPRSIGSHLCRQVVDQTLAGMVIRFLPEGPSVRRILVVPQIQEAPFHELLISDPVRGKVPQVPQGLQRLCPSSLPGSIISVAGRRVPFATTPSRSDAQLRRSLQNDRTKGKLVRCSTARASLSLSQQQ